MEKEMEKEKGFRTEYEWESTEGQHERRLSDATASSSSTIIPTVMTTSPPAPPPFFNPPADMPHETPSPGIGSPAGPSPPLETILHRPELLPLQRLAGDSNTSSNESRISSGTLSGSSSEGQEHLMEMREKLLSEGSQGSHSGPSSRRGSMTDITKLDVNVTVPTPPLEDVATAVGAGVGSSRRQDDIPVERAWDSVWPAPGHASRSSFQGDTARFPTAPVSPFVTPSFSPAAIASTSRRPMSPTLTAHHPHQHQHAHPHPGSPTRREGSPLRTSPRTTTESPSFSPAFPIQDTRRSDSSSPSALSFRHQRSQSGSGSATSPRIFDFAAAASPPRSPPASPRKQSTAVQIPPLPLRDNRPGSPLGPSPRRSAQYLEPKASHLSVSRPRGKTFSGGSPSLGSTDELTLSPRPDSPRPAFRPSPNTRADEIPDMNVPMASLPPPLTTSALPPPLGIIQRPSSPPLAPVPRAPSLRRAISDYDSKARSTPPNLLRSMSITAELDQSPKRGPQATPHEPSTETTPRQPPAEDSSLDDAATHDTALQELGLVDEGDMLPTGDFDMDITFDDEGLNTLERIFLLSKSDFGFHRAYVARVLGELLEDVDPCESVEYVLPLLSTFSMDPEEAVKEAFAEELHKVLWYFYSNCRILARDETGEDESPEHGTETETEAEADSELGGHPAAGPGETVTVTSAGIEIVPRMSSTEIGDIPFFNGNPTASLETGEFPLIDPRRRSIASTAGPSSIGSNSTKHDSLLFGGQEENGTPNSTAGSSASTAFSAGGAFVNPFADDGDSEKSWAKDSGPLMKQPLLSAHFFTPLLGSLLLNANPTISQFVRGAVVAVIARLRGKPNPEHWARTSEPDERRTFASQEGPHCHDLRPFSAKAKAKVEEAVIADIVIGMARLSTDVPESLLAEHERMHGTSGDDPDVAVDVDVDAEAFQEQMIIEAITGKAVAMNLIGSVCEYYSPEELVEREFIDEIVRCRDSAESVRTEAATALSFVAKLAPMEHIPRLISLFKSFTNDEADVVRQATTISLAPLCRRVEDTEERKAIAIEAISILTESAPTVVYAALEIIGEIIYILEDENRGPPGEILEAYLEDRTAEEDEEKDSDWDYVLAFNFPAVCLTVGPGRWHEIQPLFLRIQRRAGNRILLTMASFLHELAKILTPVQVAEDLLPVFERCMAGEDEIRERLLEHFDVFVQRLPVDIAWQLYASLEIMWRDRALGGWRVREKFSLHVSALLRLFDQHDRRDVILDMTQLALLDPFAAVRDAATVCIPESYTILVHGSKCATRFRSILLDLASSAKFKQRVTFVRCLRQFIKPPPNRKAFEEFFIPALPRLSTDVVDVRLGLAQVIADLFVVGAFYHASDEIPEGIKELWRLLKDDEAYDVRGVVKHLDLDLERFRKEKEAEESAKEGEDKDQGEGETVRHARMRGKAVLLPYGVDRELVDIPERGKLSPVYLEKIARTAREEKRGNEV